MTLNKKQYKVIGIDTYSLENILDDVVEWISYTLIDSEKNKTWVSGPFNDYFIQWSAISKQKFEKAAKNHLNLNLSGLANISFEGNQGYSTPFAELLWIELTEQQYSCVVMERFLKQNTDKKIEVLKSYYQTGKIVKDFNL